MENESKLTPEIELFHSFKRDTLSEVDKSLYERILAFSKYYPDTVQNNYIISHIMLNNNFKMPFKADLVCNFIENGKKIFEPIAIKHKAIGSLYSFAEEEKEIVHYENLLELFTNFDEVFIFAEPKEIHYLGRKLSEKMIKENPAQYFEMMMKIKEKLANSKNTDMYVQEFYNALLLDFQIFYERDELYKLNHQIKNNKVFPL